MRNAATRITADLGDPRLLRLLRLEAQTSNSSVKAVLVRALEGYFSHCLETKALERASESAFVEWNDPRDADYDKL